MLVMETDSELERVEKIRAGVLLASGDIDKKDIATEIGCAPTTISTLISDRRLGPDLQTKFEDWLRHRKYWLRSLPTAASETPTPYNEDNSLLWLATELEALVGHLRLKINPNDRLQFAVQKINLLHSTLESQWKLRNASLKRSD